MDLRKVTGEDITDGDYDKIFIFLKALEKIAREEWEDDINHINASSHTSQRNREVERGQRDSNDI